MIEITILIPRTDTEGCLWTSERRQWWRELLCARHGGFTRGPSREGGWLGFGGKVMIETGEEWVVAVEGLRELATLVETLEMAKDHFNQEAIYVRYLDRAELI